MGVVMDAVLQCLLNLGLWIFVAAGFCFLVTTCSSLVIGFRRGWIQTRNKREFAARMASYQVTINNSNSIIIACIEQGKTLHITEGVRVNGVITNSWN